MTWAPWLAAYLMAAPMSRCQVPPPARLGTLMDRIRAAGARPTVPAGLLPLGPRPATADANTVPSAGVSPATLPNDGPVVTHAGQPGRGWVDAAVQHRHGHPLALADLERGPQVAGQLPGGRRTEGRNRPGPPARPTRARR